jgi:glutamate synthase domain-containing protein 3
VALVLGSVGPNLGSGMTGGCVYLFEAVKAQLNSSYVKAEPLNADDATLVQKLLDEHARETGSALATCLLRDFEPGRFTKVTTCVIPERWDS